MPFNPRPLVLLSMLAYVAALAARFEPAQEPDAAPPLPREVCWRVAELRPGMKGHGLTVLKGVKVETFRAEVLGVLHNTSPGRDLVLCRLSGLDLEKTGVIAGMSGSPVYVQDKLVGAVAYAWPYGKEPIAGVTPFCQMRDYVAAFEQRHATAPNKAARVALPRPLRLGERTFESVTVAGDCGTKRPHEPDGLWLVPLQTPLSASGFTAHSLHLLRERAGELGMVPMQGGAAGAHALDEARGATLTPGSPLAVALIRGDFDLSAIGTTTYVDGNHVYGWGHPFMSLGRCELPLMTGYIHTVYPRQTVSFKMGSPLEVVGTLSADVSTGVAGRVGPAPGMLPVQMDVALEPDAPMKTFHVRVARQRALLPNLVFTALTNSVDMQGELPEELTAQMEATVHVEGRPPLVIKDTFSGFSGGRAPSALYNPLAAIVQHLVANPYLSLNVQRIDCSTRIVPGRRSAEIEAVELEAAEYAPGDTVRAAVFVRPYKGGRRRLTAQLRLPTDLPDGTYTATICDDMTATRMTMRDDATLNSPGNLDQLYASLRLMTGVQRTHLAMRLPTGTTGVVADGAPLPDLPASMVQIFASGRRTGAQPLTSAIVSRQPTEWVLQGSEAVRFTVSRRKRTTHGE